MPPLPALRVSALGELASSLRYAPQLAARRHVEQAERLWHTLDDHATYPEDWLVFHLTGFRPELPEPALLVGSALRRELGALIERLCVPARYRLVELHTPQGPWLTRDELVSRWRVSARTLERARRRGLLSRRVLDDAGRGRTLYDRAGVERLEREHPELLRPDRAPARISAKLARRLYQRALRYQQRLGWSVSAIADRLARRTGRSRRGVLGALQRIDRALPQPRLSVRGVLSEHDARLIARAVRMGVPARSLSNRLGKSVPAIVRAGQLELARTLREQVRPPVAPGAETDLQHPAARVLERAAPARSLVEHVAAAQVAGWPDARTERARVLAHAALITRARTRLDTLDHLHPRAADLDAIVTDLRWASRLRGELVRSQQLLVLSTIRAHLGRELLELDPRFAATLLRACCQSVGLAVDRHDPSRGGRLAAPAGIELSRVCAQASYTQPPARRARSLAHDAALGDWTRTLPPWQAWTEPPAGLGAGLGCLDPAHRTLLIARFGLASEPPRTLDELARERGASVSTLSRLIAGLLDRARRRRPERA